MDRKKLDRIILNVLDKKSVTMEDFLNIKRYADIKQMLLFVKGIQSYPNMQFFLRETVIQYDDMLSIKYPHIFTGQFREDILIKEIIGELRFLTSQILLGKNTIQEFLTVRKNYECLFMRGEFYDSIKAIEFFEKKYGYSFWSLDCRISALSFCNVLAAEEFCNTIINNCFSISVKTYVNIGKCRFIKDFTGTYFKAQFENYIQNYEENEKGSNIKEAFKRFIVLNTDIVRGLDLNDIRYLLIISNYVSLIDKYIILEKILGWLCSWMVYQKNDLYDCAMECSYYLNEQINASLWKNISILFRNMKEIDITEEKLIVNGGLNLFCAGKKEECYYYCIDMLEKYPNCFPLINLLAKSGECFDKSVPYLELAWFIRKLYMKEGKNTSFVSIVNLCDVYERIFSLFSFGNNFSIIIENETKPIMLKGKISYINSLISLNFIPSKLAFFLPEDEQRYFISNYKKKVGELYFCDWQIATYSEATDKALQNYTCDETSYLLNKIKNNNFEVNSIENININICKSYILKRQFDLAVEKNELSKAIDVYVKAFFISQWMVLKIDCNKINQKITRKMKNYLEYELSYCIYAYITRFELSKGENISETVANSCGKIIKNIGDSIIDLVLPEDELEKMKFVYFLRNICTYDGLRRVKMGVALVQELYGERIQIIDKILPYYENELEDINALNKEKNSILAKIEYLDIDKCINRGKINTSWVMFSDEAEAAMISMYNMIENKTLSSYINAFAIVKKDYVQEINRILSITIRHGILEGELLKFLKKGKISLEIDDLSDKNRSLIECFYGKIYSLIEKLLNDYIVSTYKYEKNTMLLLYVDEDLLIKSFDELSEDLDGPEDIEEIYRDILNTELEKRLPDWGEKICTHIDKEMRKYLRELFENSEGNLKIDVNRICDLLSEEIDKLKEWFKVTENQNVPYRLVALSDVLKQEWGSVRVHSYIHRDITVSGNVINFLYTIIRELIWNAEKYSGFKEGDSRLIICINVKEEGKNIVFEVTNNIEEEVDLQVIDENIRELQETIESVKKIDTKIFNRKDISEGKSGYKKIVKLLKRNYDGKYQIGLQRNANKFTIKIALAMEALIWIS